MIQRDAIPSRALGVWRRLYTRFKLEPGPASIVPDVAKTIQPVTQVDPALRRSAGDTKDLDLSAAAGAFVNARTVPDGESWYLTSIHVGSSVGGSSAAMLLGSSQVRFSDLSTADHGHTLRHKLEPGDQIGAISTGSAGDNARRWDASWEEEDV